jgi:hypothetical protein
VHWDYFIFSDITDASPVQSDRVLKKEVCSAKGTLASGKLPSKKYVVTLKEDGSLNFAKEKSQDEVREDSCTLSPSSVCL